MTLGDERVVSLTTFRRTGEPVSTPVWVVRDASSLVVYTPAASGKARRLRADPRVTLRACDRRGRVAAGAPTVEATAEVDDDPRAVAEVEGLVRLKYGWEFAAFRLVEAGLRRLRGGGSVPDARVVLRVTVM